tara:strand:+ start:5335 stop:6093 length:759 start_codon:yes stop_codon:yes gene_type:complete
MARATWGTTNLSSNNSLYYSCFRAIRMIPIYNQSQSDYIRSSVDPFLYFGNSGSTNSNYGTYVYNKGYVYSLGLVNDSPSYGTIQVYRGTTLVTSTATNGGSTNTNNCFVSANYSFINIRFVTSAGGQFNGWRSAANGGGSLITTSTNYNAYHTNANVYNKNFWYTYTQASGPSSESAIIGYGTPSFRACFYSNSINIYYNDSYTVMSSPTLSRFSTLSSNWGTSTYVSNSTIVRFWNGSSGWSGSSMLCLM